MNARDKQVDAPSADSEPQGGSAGDASDAASEATRPREIGGRYGPDPTRYGDWEKNGRCIDF